MNANTLVFLSLISSLVAVLLLGGIFTAPSDLLFKAPGIDNDQIRTSLAIFALGTAIAVPASLGSRLALGIQKGFINNYVNLGSALGVFLAVLAGSIWHCNLYYFVIAFICIPVAGNAGQTILMLRWNSGLYSPLWRAFEWRVIVRLLGRGIPFMGLAFAGAVTYQTDSLIVIYIVGAAGAAVFGVVSRLFSGLTTMFSGGFQQMWASTAHALAEGDLGWVRKSFTRTFAITISLYAIASLLLIFGGALFVRIWAGASVVPDQGLMVAFALWNLYAFSMSQMSMLLNGANKVKVQAVTACLMALANIPVTIGLTKVIGLGGPLYGSLICHAVFVGIPTAAMAFRLLNPKGR